MDCNKYFEAMSAALDGELTAEERRELDSHLAACPHCAALFEELSAQSRALRALDAPFPAGLHDRIMGSLPAQDAPVKKNKVIHWKRWGSLAACLVLVAAAVFAMPRFGGRTAGESYTPAMEPPAANEEPVGYSNGVDTKINSADGSYEMLPQNTAAVDTESVDGSAAIPYSKVQYLRVGYGFTPEAPSAVVIANAHSLSDYLAGYGTNRFDEDMDPVPIPELEALPGFYTEDFFADRCLLMVLVTEGSGSVSHEIRSVTADTVTVRRIVPEAGTCDMAAWLLVIELDELLDDGSILNVAFTE